MILDGLLTILQSLFGWLFLLILQMLLKIVDALEKFFNIFAGTEPVYYKGEPSYLFDLFFSNNAITKLFWAMAIIAAVLSFGFCIVAVARKVTDVSGTTKHTLGQIVSNFIRSLGVILLLNICIVAAINVTTVVFDRINFSLENADALDLDVERRYTDEEFATMTRILATMGNYAANPSSGTRYNVNACFNAIRGEMLTLFEAKCFDYDFPIVQTSSFMHLQGSNQNHSWQSALALVAKSADLRQDLQLDTYYPAVQDAILLCFDQLKTNPNFKPQETAVLSRNTSESLSTAKLIFLVTTMGAEENSQFRNGSFEDALRRSYINGEKDYLSFSDVNTDFAITKINYLVGLLVAIAIILNLGKIILVFIVRMLNLIMLYVISPLFASSMSLDEGSRFQNWVQSFVMQLLAAYGSVVMMRIYLLMVPLVVNNDLYFFPQYSEWGYYNIYGQLLFVLAGAWAVASASTLISGALTGNASSAFIDADNTFGRILSDAAGTSRLAKEWERFRNNRARDKSNQKNRKEDKKEREDAANKKKQENLEKRNSGRTNNTADKRAHEDNGSNIAANRMRQDAGLDGNISNNKSYTDDLDRESSRLSKMRSQMGFDAPSTSRSSINESPDSFSLDSLPDLGKTQGKKTGGTTTTTNNNLKGKTNRTSTGPTITNTKTTDGTGSTKNPNGTGSTKNPNGTGSTKNPNGTGSTKKPNGTGSTKNPNGTGSTKNPNGTGNTNTIGGNLNNNTNLGGRTVTGGTVNGGTVNGGTTNIGTNGTGSTKNLNGTGSTKNPNGTGNTNTIGGNLNNNTNLGGRTVTSGTTNIGTNGTGGTVTHGTTSQGNTDNTTINRNTTNRGKGENITTNRGVNTGGITNNNPVTQNPITETNTTNRRTNVNNDRNVQMHSQLRDRIHNRNRDQA